MKRLPRILKILSVNSFIVRTLWNNGEIRDIDFEPLLTIWNKEEETIYQPLNDLAIFETVQVSPDHTLYWPTVTVYITFKGTKKGAPLDLDPDVLYEKSTLVEKYERPHIGRLLKTAREKAGLSQMEVAINCGTSRTYLSRIENEHSDIQFDVFYKIVILGMGKKLKVLIE